MPVVQLQDDTGENLGKALGAVGGYLATQKQRKTDKAAATARQTAADARAATAADDAHAQITDAIKVRDAGLDRTNAQDLATKNSQGAYQKYLPMLSNPPVQPGQPALHGPALANALQKIKLQAASDGMTSPEDVKNFDVEIAGALQRDQAANTPKISDVEHGLPQLKPGASAQDISKHYLDAASRVIQNANIPPDQQKLIADQFQKLAAEAIKAAPKPPATMTPYQTQELQLRREELNRPRGGGGSGIGQADLAERTREFNLTHNKDGSTKGRGDSGNVTPQQRAAAIRGAVSTLGAQQIQPPNDPNFPAVLKQFGDPANRDAILNDPHMPPKTKAYLQQLDAMVP